MLRKSQQGFLLILAVFLIVVIGFVVGTISYLSVGSQHASVNKVDTTQAFYIANAGLQRGVFGLLNAEYTCAGGSTSLSSNLNSVAFGNGTFSVSGQHYPTGALPLLLSSSINASTTTIPVLFSISNTLFGYAPYGAVVIDKEFITYRGYGSGSATCGSGVQYCLLYATRGALNTTPTSHSILSLVGQNQCKITATGYVPNATSPTGSRTLSTNLIAESSGWILRTNVNDNYFGKWQNGSWGNFGNYGFLGTGNSTDLNSIFILNFADAWVVGDKQTGRSLTAHWDGFFWTRVSGPSSLNTDLNNIFCTSSNNCWAVGNSKTFIRWTGASSWSQDTSQVSALPNASYNAVTCNLYAGNPANECWAVGDPSGGANIARWNGSNWSMSPGIGTLPSIKLNAITCPAANICYAVGNNTSGYLYIAKWDGSSWSKMTSTPANNYDLNAIACNGPTDCWVAGDGSSLARLSGTTWTTLSSPVTSDFNTISCTSASNCWAAGTNSGVAHWNGTSWSASTTGTAGDDFTGIYQHAPQNAILYWNEQ